MQPFVRYLLGFSCFASLISSAPSVQAAIVKLGATLDIDQEVPTPTIPMGLNPTGTADITYDTDSNLLSWIVTYNELTSPTLFAHFHGPADFGATAGVQVVISSVPFTSPTMGSTTIDETQETQLLSGLWYVNIHTQNNGPGEIRGQVLPVPEPSSMIALFGLGAFGLLFHRRVK